MSLRRLAVATWLAVALSVLGGAALAVETPAGSKNFAAPGYVPNYFSNEAGSFQGRVAAPSYGAAPAYAAPRARARQVVVITRHGRYRPVARSSARGRTVAGYRTSGRQVVHGASRSRAAALRIHSRGVGRAVPARGHAGVGGSHRIARR